MASVSPFYDLILVEIKSVLLNYRTELKSHLFEHIEKYARFYSLFNTTEYGSTASEALEKWIVRLSLDAPLATDLSQNEKKEDAYESLLTIRGKQSELMNQYQQILQNLVGQQDTVSVSQICDILERITETSAHDQNDLIEWAQSNIVRRVKRPAAVKSFVEFLRSERIEVVNLPTFIKKIDETLSQLFELDQRVVALQTHFSNVCYNYRKQRSQGHYNQTLVQERTHQFNILHHLTQFLEHNTLEPLLLQAVNGWGQLHLDGQDEEWDGWGTLTQNIVALPLEDVPPDLHESVGHLKQLVSKLNTQ